MQGKKENQKNQKLTQKKVREMVDKMEVALHL